MNRAIWANLFWKEWREHRWKLAALTAILLGGFVCVWAYDFRESTLPLCWFMLMLYTPLASLFIGMGIAAGEQARGTVGCLQQLPASTRIAAITKLVIGFATVAIPGLLLVGLGWLVSTLGWTQELDSKVVPLSVLGSKVWWIETCMVFLLSCASLLLWVVSAGANQSTELRAGAWALLVVIGVWVVSASTMGVVSTQVAAAEPGEFGDRLLSAAWLPTAALPGGSFLASTFSLRQFTPAYRLVVWSLGFGVHAALLIWWTTRYAPSFSVRHREVSEKPGRSIDRSWLGPPLPSPLRAILWKQVRECLPVIGGVIALALGYATCMTLIEGNVPDTQSRLWAVIWFTAMSGFLAALLVGVASFQDDLSAGVSSFWRSRPIDPDQWFWIKYASGLAVLAIVFSGVYALSWMLDPHESAQNSGYALQAVLAFWTVYSSAVCVACLVRNVLYAGILSFAVAAYATWIAWVPYNGEQLPVALQLLILTSVSVGLTLLAWRAMRRDWALRLA